MDNGASSPPGPSRGGGFIGLAPPTEWAILRREPRTAMSKRLLMRAVTSSSAPIIRSLSANDSDKISIFFARESACAWIANNSLLWAGPLSFMQPVMNSLKDKLREPSSSITPKSLAASESGSPSCLIRICTSGFLQAFKNSSKSNELLPSSSPVLKISLMLSNSALRDRSSRSLRRFSLFWEAVSMSSTMTLTTMFMMPNVEINKKRIQNAVMYH
mmetsp:Transcript_59330/g.170418  ORF Transcript_59330/g.170418 Transcript_59330/m.170418 type:complete len:216 (-) Transcript_59330:1011-1658(-)